jgi:hypothetical protein
LEYLSSGSWREYCPGGTAVPLQGTWSSSREHLPGDAISFACTHGAARKCTVWGYVAGSSPAEPLWNHHQACVRMANADHCGDGTPHTREGTPIWIRDAVDGGRPDGPPLAHWTRWPEPPPPDAVFLEAAWKPSGAVCLSKFRWASRPLGRDCPTLRDPRRESGLRFCEDYTTEALLDAGVLVWNGSLTMDLPLNHWENAAGDKVATVRGYWSELDGGSMPPFPGYTIYRGREGFLLRNLPGSLTFAQVTRIGLQQTLAGSDAGADLTLGDDTPLPGHQFVPDGFEGWALISDGGAGLTPLNLYQNGTDYAAALTAPNGYSLIQHLGYGIAEPP